MQRRSKKRSIYSLGGAVVALGILVLLFGAYIFYSANGMSYLSNNSESCNNCHIMNDVYNDWLSGSHSQKVDGKPRASCGDCHLPHDFVPKWIAKAQSGLSHAYSFTFNSNHPTHLSANEKSKKMIQDSCVSCHSKVVESVVNPTTSPHYDQPLNCVSCHGDVGHKRGF